MSGRHGTAQRPGRRQGAAAATAANQAPPAPAPTGQPTAAPQRRGARSTGVRTSPARRIAPPASTPAALRRIGATGLLAGALLGAGGFAATSTAADSASDAASAATSHDALDRASTAGSLARAESAQAILARTSADASSQAQQRAASALSTVAAGVAGSGTDGHPAPSQAAGEAVTHADLVDRARDQGSVSDVASVQNHEKSWAAPVDTARSGRAVQVESDGTRHTLALAGGVGAGLVGTALFAGSAVSLARRRRRIVNPPLVGSTLLGALVLVGTISSVAGASGTVNQAEDLVSDRPIARVMLSQVSALREAQLDGLLSTPVSVQRERQNAAATMESADTDVRTAWRAYAASVDATQSRQSSNLAGARTEATTTGARTFENLVAAIDRQGGWNTPRTAEAGGAGPMPWLLLLGGIGAGGLAAYGAARARQEYR